MKSTDLKIRNSTPASRPQSGRIGNFMLTLGIMALSFFFYELGLFGGVQGPLNPEQLGATLARAGITRLHLAMFFLFCSFYALTWNWVLNAWHRRNGNRLTCIHAGEEDCGPCGAPVRRQRRTGGKIGRDRIFFLCSNGHRCSQADFHPVTKGALSNCIWTCCLLFALAFIF